METVGILSIPNEVLHLISRYLTLNDLHSCSSTCHAFREALNDNSVWKRFLFIDDVKLPSLEEGEMPSNYSAQHTLLPPLCSNRLCVMKKVQILNNWTYGRCSYHIIQKDFGHLSKGKRKLISAKSMYLDSFVFLVARFYNITAVELWDIKDKPAMITSVEVKSVDKLEVVGDLLIIINRCQIFIHEISIKNKALSMKYGCMMTSSGIELTSPQFKCNHTGTERDFIHSCRYRAYKDMLISCLKNKLFIWNITKASTVYNFTFSDSLYIDPMVDFSYGNHLLLQTFSNSINGVFKPNSSYKMFDTFQMHLLDLKPLVGVPRHVVLQKLYVVTFSAQLNISNELDLSCSVYDKTSFKILCKNKFSCFSRAYSCVSRIKVVDGFFAFIGTESNINIVDVSSLSILHSIECEPYGGLIPFFSHLNILSSLFLVIRDEGNFSVWNVNTKKLLPTLPVISNGNLQMSFNRWCSRVVCFDLIMGSISALSFL